MANEPPLSNPTTAYKDLKETEYKAELELVDRYQAFTAELLRLSLAGVAVLGFLYEKVFTHLRDNHKEVPGSAQCAAAWSIGFFAVAAVCSLVHRYFSTEGFRYYVDGLRLSSDNARSRAELAWRGYMVWICIYSKAGAVISLAFGAALLAQAFIQLLSR